MSIYPVHQGNDPDLDPWGSLAGLGVEVLAGEPHAFGKVEYAHPDTGAKAGYFAVTQGEFRMTYPYDEHAVVIEGECILLNEATGESNSYHAGDAWFVRKGTSVRWTVMSSRFVKHYMSVA